MDAQEQQELLRHLRSFLTNFNNEFTDRDQDGELCCTIYPDIGTKQQIAYFRKAVKKGLPK